MLQKGIQILIENNVISKIILRFKDNPFLMADADECMKMENTSSNVNLLIDVGHLKVSLILLNLKRKF